MRVEKEYVEKIVYRDKAESDVERDFSEQEEVEETFNIVGRVKVGESERVVQKTTGEEF